MVCVEARPSSTVVRWAVSPSVDRRKRPTFSPGWPNAGRPLHGGRLARTQLRHGADLRQLSAAAVELRLVRLAQLGDALGLEPRAAGELVGVQARELERDVGDELLGVQPLVSLDLQLRL